MSIYLSFKDKKDKFNSELNDNTKRLLNIINLSEKDLNDGYIISKVREFEKDLSRGEIPKPLSKDESLFVRRYIFNDKSVDYKISQGSIVFTKININAKLQKHFYRLNKIKNTVKSKINDIDARLQADSDIRLLWNKNDITSCKDMLFFTNRELNDISTFLSNDKLVLNQSMNKIKSTGLINNNLYIDDIVESIDKSDIKKLEDSLGVSKRIAEKLNSIGYTIDNIENISKKDFEELNFNIDTIEKIKKGFEKKKPVYKIYKQSHEVTNDEFKIRKNLLKDYIQKNSICIDEDGVVKNTSDYSFILKYFNAFSSNKLIMMSMFTEKELENKIKDEFTSEEKRQLSKIRKEYKIKLLDEIFDVTYIDIDECDYTKLHGIIKNYKIASNKNSTLIALDIYGVADNHTIDNMFNNTVKYTNVEYTKIMKYLGVEDIESILENVGYDKKGYMVLLTNKETKEVYKYTVGNISDKYINDEEFINNKLKENINMKSNKKEIIGECKVEVGEAKDTVKKSIRKSKNIKTKGVKITKSVKNRELRDKLIENLINGDKTYTMYQISIETGYSRCTVENEYYKMLNSRKKKEEIVVAAPVVKEELVLNSMTVDNDEAEIIELRRINKSLQKMADNYDTIDKEINDKIAQLKQELIDSIAPIKKKIEELEQKLEDNEEEYLKITEEIDRNKVRINSLM